MLKEFKEFAVKGNLVDIAVGFVMGAAFKQVVTSFTGGIISPLVGLIFKADFKDLKWIAREKDGTLFIIWKRLEMIKIIQNIYKDKIPWKKFQKNFP